MRTLVIGDIHGHATALESLLEAAALAPGDRLITLGDYVDRGPATRQVLDRLIALYATGQLVPILGNHEEMMLEASQSPERLRYGIWRGCGGNQTLASYGKVQGTMADLQMVPEEHWRFLREACVEYFETETHLFTHANLDPDLPLDQQSAEMLRWMKFDEPPRHISGKTFVCGHTRQMSGYPRVSATAVCLDTGIYSGGWLTCLELETGRFWQANKDGTIRQGHTDELLSPEDEAPKLSSGPP